MYKKKTYNPGLVDCYQKPWYRGSDYVGQFCKPGYPNEVWLSFDPLRRLIYGAVTDPELQDEILEMIEEMQDAVHAMREEHLNSLPSSCWD